MKIVPLVGLVLAMCATATQEEEVRYRVLTIGGYSEREETRPVIATVTNASEFAVLWRTVAGQTPAPALDFSRESAVFLFAGQKPTGGYSLEVRSVVVKGDRAEVEAEIHVPPGGAVVTQVITFPHAVIAIERPRISGAVWHARDGAVVAEERKVK